MSDNLDKGFFLWNYVLEIPTPDLPKELQGPEAMTEVVSACIHWLHQDLFIDSGKPIQISKGGIGVYVNLTQHEHTCWEVFHPPSPHCCPNYPGRQCNTIISRVLSPHDPIERSICFSYLIEGSGYTEQTITNIVETLVQFHRDFIEELRPPKVNKSLTTRLGLRDAEKALQAKAWPRLLNAIDNKFNQRETYTAFLLDYANRFKHFPKTDRDSELLADMEFVSQLSKCYANKAKVIDPISLYMLVNWTGMKLYTLQDKELAKHIEKRFKQKIAPRTLAKRAETIGLVFDRPTGPKPKFEQ